MFAFMWNIDRVWLMSVCRTISECEVLRNIFYLLLSISIIGYQIYHLLLILIIILFIYY